jgi:hypothetical protein
VGGRLEIRYDRFSFAVTDFYGYNDGAYVDPIFTYSRNVDPLSGRPRHTMATGPCRTGKEASCLTEKNALTQHSVNQQNFHFICATSIGFNNLDTTACGQTIYTSQNIAVPEEPLSPTIAVAVGAGISGQDADAVAPITGGGLFLALAEYGPSAQAEVRAMTAGNNGYANGARTPLVALVVDPNDGPEMNHPNPIQNIFAPYGLSPVLTDEQEALLGCGAFYGTNCDIDGMDLMNSEASASMLAWPHFEGTFVQGQVPLTTDGRFAQPGTLGFQGGPVCTRYEGGKTFVLPGCRGPRDYGYDRNVDGSTFGEDGAGVGQRDVGRLLEHPDGDYGALLSRGSQQPAGRRVRCVQTLSHQRLLLRRAVLLQQRLRLRRHHRSAAERGHRRRQRQFRTPGLHLARRGRSGASLPEAQRAGLLDGLCRGLHQVELGHGVHLDRGAAFHEPR